MKKIILSRGKIALVSDQDYTRINAFKWHFNGKYAARQIPDPTGEHHHKTLYMHNEIMHPGKTTPEIDHQDHNKLNNQRDNLIEKTHAANLQNRDFKKQNSYTGVQTTPAGKHQAKIRIGGKNKGLGNFKTAKEAADAYDTAAKKYYGPKAKTNRKG